MEYIIKTPVKFNSSYFSELIDGYQEMSLSPYVVVHFAQLKFCSIQIQKMLN